MQVDEIALQTTTFIKWDGSRIVLPNSYLFANMLTNMTRSKEKADIFKVRKRSKSASCQRVDIMATCIYLVSPYLVETCMEETGALIFMQSNFHNRKQSGEGGRRLRGVLLSIQFLVDMGTDSSILERTEEVAKKVAADNPKDFKGNPSVSAQIGGDKDPMKFYVQVFWTFCYNGTLS